jgi:hypothetical protein
MAFFYVSLHPMKQKIAIICLLCLWTTLSFSQARIILPDSSQITRDPDSLALLPRRVDPPQPKVTVAKLQDSIQPARFTAWKIVERTGDRYIVPMDTALHNYHQKTIPDGYSVAMGYLGNLGSPLISKIFFDRKEKDQFVFYDSYYPYNKDPDNQLFYNVRIPNSNLSYQTAGS